jgi:hypothetical protein
VSVELQSLSDFCEEHIRTFVSAHKLLGKLENVGGGGGGLV